MKTRNFMQIALIAQFGGKGGIMHDRRAPRGGAKNEQVEYLKEYEDSKEDLGRVLSRPVAGARLISE